MHWTSARTAPAKVLEQRSSLLLYSRHEMNGVSEAIVTWLERKRRTDRTSAALIALLALSFGTAVFLVMTLLVYALLSMACGAFVQPAPWLGPAALAFTSLFFARSMKTWRHGRDLVLDPMGFWIIRDFASVGPRLILEGLRHVRCCAQLGELNVDACARALAHLAGQNAAIPWDELVRHCPQVPRERLAEQLSLLDGVLFLAENASRVTLMDPLRLRLRWMLDQEQKAGRRQEPERPRPNPPVVPLNEPEKLSPFEILGLSPSASPTEIKAAYRKRVKECHPDLFVAMDQQAKDLAERWTKALNAAYATLSPRNRVSR